MHFETRCVHVGVDKDPAYKGVITPIYPTSTFAWDNLTTNRGYDYTRSGNPTRTALEENLASLEGGIDCRATSTGMSAITAAIHLFQPGDHIIAGHDIYGGTYRLFADVYAAWGFRFSFVDMRRPGECPPGPHAGDERHLDRDAEQPALERRRYRRRDRDRPRGRRNHDRRQHLFVPLPAAAAGTGSGRRDALDDEIS